MRTATDHNDARYRALKRRLTPAEFANYMNSLPANERGRAAANSGLSVEGLVDMGIDQGLDYAKKKAAEAAAEEIAPSLMANWGALGTGPQAGILLGTKMGIDGAMDIWNGDETHGPYEWGSRATIGIATGGLSELARATGLFGHKSTKEYQKERWDALVEEGKLTPEQAQHFGHKEDDDSIYDEGPRKGQKWNFETALEDAKVDPRHFAQTLGTSDIFGQDWFKLTDPQRDTLVKRLADEGQYYSDKGDILIRDEDLARQYYDEVLAMDEKDLLHIDPNTTFGGAGYEGEQKAAEAPQEGAQSFADWAKSLGINFGDIQPAARGSTGPTTSEIAARTGQQIASTLDSPEASIDYSAMTPMPRGGVSMDNDLLVEDLRMMRDSGQIDQQEASRNAYSLGARRGRFNK